MWIMTKYGFFSVVCAWNFGEKENGPDENTLIVRARSIDHLELLRNKFFPGVEIKVSVGIEYPCRMIVYKDTWQTCMFAMSGEIDYCSLKSKVQEDAITFEKPNEYMVFLHQVWAAGLNLQTEIERT